MEDVGIHKHDVAPAPEADKPSALTEPVDQPPTQNSAAAALEDAPRSDAAQSEANPPPTSIATTSSEAVETPESPASSSIPALPGDKSAPERPTQAKKFSSSLSVSKKFLEK
jgi:hypothetical protein